MDLFLLQNYSTMGSVNLIRFNEFSYHISDAQDYLSKLKQFIDNAEFILKTHFLFQPDDKLINSNIFQVYQCLGWFSLEINYNKKNWSDTSRFNY